MQRNTRLRLPGQGLVKAGVLIALAALGGLAVFGPAGLLAWSENSRMLAQKQAELARLEAERDVLRNRVELLDPRHADPDLVGELLRKNLNVAHPDEVVVARP